MRLLRTILLFLAVAVFSCKSDPAAPTSAFKNSADAIAAEDTKSGGIYKGVIVGSSGFVIAVLQNGLLEIRVTVDNEKRTLTTTGLTTWVSGATIKNAVFTSGDWSAKFSVGGAGASPQIILDLAGHPGAQAVLLKELSNGIVRVYEGTYSGTESGTWNFVVQGPILSGVSRIASGASYSTFNGIIFGNDITLQAPMTGSGTFSVDNVNGTWKTDTSTSGTWTGKRMM